MSAQTKSTVGKSWWCVGVSLASLLVGLPIALPFSTPTAVGLCPVARDHYRGRRRVHLCRLICRVSSTPSPAQAHCTRALCAGIVLRSRFSGLLLAACCASRMNTTPNPAAPGNGAIAIPFHGGRSGRAVPESQC